MFRHVNKPTALAPGDMILVALGELTRRVDVRRGNDMLAWIADGEDFWPYFCQMIKTPEDAYGVAQALAGAAGHAVQRVEPLMFRIVALAPSTPRKGKK